jgi:hypothetical protein
MSEIPTVIDMSSTFPVEVHYGYVKILILKLTLYTDFQQCFQKHSSSGIAEDCCPVSDVTVNSHR